MLLAYRLGYILLNFFTYCHFQYKGIAKVFSLKKKENLIKFKRRNENSTSSSSQCWCYTIV